jgi:hypothetical protein
MSYAASELSGTLEKISGVKLATVKATAAPKLNVVKLSSDSREDLHDEFSVSMKPGVIELWGNTQRGTLFAVYALLREKFDARWYWPGESGEFLRKFSRYDVKSWQKKWRPFFDLREMSICSIWRHRHADTERWFPKVFLNCGIQTPSIREEIDYVRRTSGHHVSLPVTMKEREQIFAEHPEWFSLLNGKRDIKGIAGCWSNEGFYSYTVSNLVKRIKNSAPIDISKAGEKMIVPMSAVIVKMKKSNIRAENSYHFLWRRHPEGLCLVSVSRVNANSFHLCIKAVVLLFEFIRASKEISNSVSRNSCRTKGLKRDLRAVFFCRRHKRGIKP